MPELPEVETMCRGIGGVVGRRILAARPLRCRYKPIRVTPRPSTLAKRVVGKTITAVERVGKRVVLRLESGDAIVIQPRMAGLVLLGDPPDEVHLRFCFRLGGRGPRELLFWDRRGLGSVELLSPREFEHALGPDKIGPDALAVTCDELRTRLGSSRRAIKVALLDQRAIAGIGNLYASEMLHAARLNPRRCCHRLRPREWSDLHAAIRKVLRQAIRDEGSTLGDGTYRNALNRPGRYQNRHRVYGRAGEACPTCSKAKVARIVQAQRSTFYCPRCQRNARSNSKSIAPSKSQ